MAHPFCAFERGGKRVGLRASRFQELPLPDTRFRWLPDSLRQGQLGRRLRAAGRKARQTRSALPRDGSLDRKVVFEPLEPRYLLSADIMPLLVDLSQFDDQTATLHVLDDTNQNKVLHAAGFKNQAAYEVWQNLADTNGVVVSGSDGNSQLIVDFSEAFSLQDGIRFAGGLGLDRFTIGYGIVNSVSFFAHGGEAGSVVTPSLHRSGTRLKASLELDAGPL